MRRITCVAQRWCCHARWSGTPVPRRPSPPRANVCHPEGGTTQGLQEVAFAGAVCLPFTARVGHRGAVADFGNRHIPPALVAGDTVEAVVAHVDDGRAI